MEQIIQILNDATTALSIKEIAKEHSKSIRTIRYNIKSLINKGIVKKHPNLLNLMAVYYKINKDYHGTDPLMRNVILV